MENENTYKLPLTGKQIEDTLSQLDGTAERLLIDSKTVIIYGSLRTTDSIIADNGKKVATEEFVQGTVADYALKEDIPTKASELDNDKGYLTEHQDLSDYAKIGDIPTVPTKVSAFENDKGYLTTHQDINHLALKNEIPTKVSELTNDANYVTQGYLNNLSYLTVRDLNDATQSKAGLMSAEDKKNLDALVASAISVLSGTVEPTSDIGKDGDIYLVTE